MQCNDDAGCKKVLSCSMRCNGDASCVYECRKQSKDGAEGLDELESCAYSNCAATCGGS
jgi:hypothetical protein